MIIDRINLMMQTVSSSKKYRVFCDIMAKLQECLLQVTLGGVSQ